MRPFVRRLRRIEGGNVDRALRGCIPKAPDTAAGCFSLRTHEVVKPRKRALTSLRHASTPARCAGACPCITTVAADRIRQHLPPPPARERRDRFPKQGIAQSHHKKMDVSGAGKTAVAIHRHAQTWGSSRAPRLHCRAPNGRSRPSRDTPGIGLEHYVAGGRESRSLHTDLPFDTVDMKIYLLYGDVNDQFGVVRPCGPVVRNRTFPYG